MKYIKLIAAALLCTGSTLYGQGTDTAGTSEQAIPQVSQIAEIFTPADGTTNTGGNTTISAKEISKRPVNNIAGAMEGVAPGVDVSGNPNDPRIVIRGLGTFNAGSEPLIVLDGAPYSGPLSSINPNDVKEIKILKDAVSKGRYGARGANGVILITSKTYEPYPPRENTPNKKRSKKEKSASSESAYFFSFILYPWLL